MGVQVVCVFSFPSLSITHPLLSPRLNVSISSQRGREGKRFRVQGLRLLRREGERVKKDSPSGSSLLSLSLPLSSPLTSAQSLHLQPKEGEDMVWGSGILGCWGERERVILEEVGDGDRYPPFFLKKRESKRKVDIQYSMFFIISAVHCRFVKNTLFERFHPLQYQKGEKGLSGIFSLSLPCPPYTPSPLTLAPCDHLQQRERER